MNTEQVIEAKAFDTVFGPIPWPDGWQEDVPVTGESVVPKYGDIVVNGHASLNNPHRVAIFLRRHERYLVMWNGDSRSTGKWKHRFDSETRIRVIGSVRGMLKALVSELESVKAGKEAFAQALVEAGGGFPFSKETWGTIGLARDLVANKEN